MDPVRPDGAARVRRGVRVARRRAAAERGADRVVGRGSRALSIRADCAAPACAGTRVALALLGSRRRGGDLSPVRRAGLSRQRDLSAWPRHRAKPPRGAGGVRGDGPKLPDALSGALRGDAVVRARAGVPPAPRGAARLDLRLLVAERLRSSVYRGSFSSCAFTFASVASNPARLSRICAATLAGARSTNDRLLSWFFAFPISAARRGLFFCGASPWRR